MTTETGPAGSEWAREWNRVAQNGTLPSPVWLALRQLPFFSPWYDPVSEASTEVALAYLASSPAAQREELAKVA